jgi:hypothetical protein
VAQFRLNRLLPDVDALRALERHVERQTSFVLTLGKEFIFDPLEEAADDGLDVVKPDDVDGGSPGRWKGVVYAALVRVLAMDGAPTAAEIPPGQAAIVKDTDGGGVALWYNDGGTLKRAELTAP